jgi:FkbM family methyltransferase
MAQRAHQVDKQSTKGSRARAPTFVRLLTHVKHALRLMSRARALGLSMTDTIRFFASDYRSRLGFAQRVFPISVHGSRVLLRSNAVDCRIATEVFGGVYAVQDNFNAKRIIDLGANIGISALYFHYRYPGAHIACVEPSPGNLNILRRVVALNQLPVTIFECAIGPESGSTLFYETDDPTCRNTLGNRNENAKRITVQQITIPEIMDLLRWDLIDILKIDIEGYERVLLRSNAHWLSRVSCIVGEIHEGYSFADLRADLAPFGFRLTERAPANEDGQVIFVAVASENLTVSP